jgi:branched-chain amino acid transport system permease protein
MNIEILIQSAIFGIFLGALYGLGAVGFSFIFGVMKILNIAHGELLMLGGYAAFFLLSLCKIDPFLSLPIVAILLFLTGAIFYKFLFARVIKFGDELRVDTSLLISFGLILILSQMAVLSFTADEVGITTSYSGKGIEIFKMQFPYIRILGFIVALIVIFGLQTFLHKTYLGKSIRAAAENWEAAILMGVNINQVYLISFSLACALAGIAGSIVVVSYSISPAIGMEWSLKAMIVTILAGVGSVGGAFVAGILLGIVESVSAIFLGPYMSVVGLIMFLLVLMLRPQGLFGR